MDYVSRSQPKIDWPSVVRVGHVCLANCYEGRYYRQIAPRKGDASPFLNGLGDSETIGAAKRTATKSVLPQLELERAFFRYDNGEDA
jgi:hypothetical protein